MILVSDLPSLEAQYERFRYTLTEGLRAYMPLGCSAQCVRSSIRRYLDSGLDWDDIRGTVSSSPRDDKMV